MSEPLSLTIVATVMGALIGSFLNVCIYRIPRGTSVVWPASSCESCHRQISWYENLPIVSWLALRGRCRTCHTPLSISHPIVEGITAVMFGAATWYYGPSPALAAQLIFGCALIVLFAIDLEHHLLPNVITIPGIAVGFAFSFVTGPGWVGSLVGALLGGGSLWLIAEAYYRVRHEEGLGMGDVKMLAMIGAFVGWKLTLVTLMMASIAGSIVGLTLVAFRKGDMKYALPFGTFLALGAALASTVGQRLLDWYIGLYPTV
ncbi:MAG: prepilin peptidase [Acidobacteria bacterium]|nr:prepilin peptidase [Acidobacteriota bacterium]